MKWYSTYSRLVWIVLIGVFLWLVASPSMIVMEKFERISKLIESSGGKILILAIMAMLFFIGAMGFAYYIIDAVQANTLKPDDVIANLMIQFATGTAFGTVIGALVSLLGGKSNKGD